MQAWFVMRGFQQTQKTVTLIGAFISIIFSAFCEHVLLSVYKDIGVEMNTGAGFLYPYCSVSAVRSTDFGLFCSFDLPLRKVEKCLEELQFPS